MKRLSLPSSAEEDYYYIDKRKLWVALRWKGRRKETRREVRIDEKE